MYETFLIFFCDFLNFLWIFWLFNDFFRDFFMTFSKLCEIFLSDLPLGTNICLNLYVIINVCFFVSVPFLHAVRSSVFTFVVVILSTLLFFVVVECEFWVVLHVCLFILFKNKSVLFFSLWWCGLSRTRSKKHIWEIHFFLFTLFINLIGSQQGCGQWSHNLLVPYSQ